MRPLLPGSPIELNRSWLLAARIVGIIILGLSLTYLGVFVWKNGSRLASVGITDISPIWLLLGGLLFAGNHATNSMAWLAILRSLGERLSWRQVVGIGLTSQLGKYAPGNVAHQLGRAALAGRRGVPISLVAWSALIEAVLAAAACAAIGAGVMLVAPGSLAEVPGVATFAAYLPMAGAIVLVSLLGVTLLLRRLLPSRAMPSVWRPLSYYLAGYGFAGASFYAVAVAMGADELDLAVTIGAYAVAWFAGFVTPGAPAGLGVREAILVAALSGSIGPAAVSAVVAHRLVSAVVDACAFAVGALMLSWSEDR